MNIVDPDQNILLTDVTQKDKNGSTRRRNIGPILSKSFAVCSEGIPAGKDASPDRDAFGRRMT
ncbi:MAG: hypothetical protein WCX28_05765 [Bacteriovoracaceae bacterium]|nr:hypothetical protein [Bacteroidota bacterium]